MEPLQKILVPVGERADESEPALARAAALARRTGAQVTLVAVVEEVPRRLKWLHPSRVDVQRALVDATAAGIAAAADPLRKLGIAVETRVLRGTPILEVVREVLRGGHQLVVKGAGRIDGDEGGHLGSLSVQLMRKCPCLVMLVQPGHAEASRRVLATVDPRFDDPQHEDLNVRVLDAACALARLEGGEVLIAHAWTAFGAGLLRDHMPEEEYAAYIQWACDQAREALEALRAAHAPGVPRENVHLIDGEPTAVLPRFAEQHGVDLAVMGTVARTGIPGLLIGNTAERLGQRFSCSLLAVKPSGFVSPITPQD